MRWMNCLDCGDTICGCQTTLTMRRPDVLAISFDASKYSAHADPHDKGTRQCARNMVYGSRTTVARASGCYSEQDLGPLNDEIGEVAIVHVYWDLQGGQCLRHLFMSRVTSPLSMIMSSSGHSVMSDDRLS
jgi:hypothetical protein